MCQGTGSLWPVSGSCCFLSLRSCCLRQGAVLPARQGDRSCGSPAGVCWRHHRRDRSATQRGRCGSKVRPSQQIAEQYQSLDRLRHCQHRAHDPHGGDRVAPAQSESGPWNIAEQYNAFGAHLIRQHAHAWNRADYGTARRNSPGHLRGIPADLRSAMTAAVATSPRRVSPDLVQAPRPGSPFKAGIDRS